MDNKRYKVVKIQPTNLSFFYTKKNNINNECFKQTRNTDFNEILDNEINKLDDKIFLENLRLNYIKEQQDNFDINEEYNRLSSKNK